MKKELDYLHEPRTFLKNKEIFSMLLNSGWIEKVINKELTPFARGYEVKGFISFMVNPPPARMNRKFW